MASHIVRNLRWTRGSFAQQNRGEFPPITAASSTTATEVESGGKVKMTKQEIIEMIHRAGFEPVERDTVYNRVEQLAA